MINRFRTFLAAAMALAATASPAAADSVSVFAAASLKNALDELTVLWRRETGHDARVSLAGSSALARQIDAGAPADVFISANAAWMDWLEARGRLKPGSRTPVAGNRLVLIAPRKDSAEDAPEAELNSNFDLAGRLGDSRMAMALLDVVPAGIYGQAALERLGLWAGVRDRIAQADNVRAALALVAAGEAPLGVVYRTDAIAEPRTQIVARIPVDTHPEIVYPAAVIEESRNPLSTQFISFLLSDSAVRVFLAHGFAPSN